MPKNKHWVIGIAANTVLVLACQSAISVEARREIVEWAHSNRWLDDFDYKLVMMCAKLNDTQTPSQRAVSDKLYFKTRKKK